MSSAPLPVLCALLVELTGAGILARGLALEAPAEYIRWRGTAKWDMDTGQDLNYARSSADARVGFAVLVIGLVLQAVATIDRQPADWPFLLAAIAVPSLGLVVARRMAHRRLAEVIRRRADIFVIEGTWKPSSWAMLPEFYSEAFELGGRARRQEETRWEHLDRLLGEGTTLIASRSTAASGNT